jgi:hypothetical protein
LAQFGQPLQKRLHTPRLEAEEAACELVGGGLAHVVQGGEDGDDLVGYVFGPGRLSTCLSGTEIQRALRLLGNKASDQSVLLIGAQPAEQMAHFVCHPLPVHVNQVVQDFVT